VGSTQKWISITSSSDGTKLAAAVFYGNIWRSFDSGATWTEDTSLDGMNVGWTEITSSSDGTRLFACPYAGNIWSSQAWSPPSSPPRSPPPSPPSPLLPPPSPFPSLPPPSPLAVLPSHQDEALQITSLSDNKVFDDGHGKVYMGDWHGGDNQRFFIHRLEGKYFQIKIKSDSDKCLDYHTQDNNIYMNDCHTGNNQIFYLVDGNGKANMNGASNAATIATKFLGDSNVLDYNSGNNENGHIYFGTPHNGANQLFYFNTS